MREWRGGGPPVLPSSRPPADRATHRGAVDLALDEGPCPPRPHVSLGREQPAGLITDHRPVTTNGANGRAIGLHAGTNHKSACDDDGCHGQRAGRSVTGALSRMPYSV